MKIKSDKYAVICEQEKKSTKVSSTPSENNRHKLVDTNNKIFNKTDK